MRVFIQHSDWSHKIVTHPQLGFSKSNFGTSLGLNFNLKPLDIFDSLGPYPQFGILEIIATSSGLGPQPQLGTLEIIATSLGIFGSLGPQSQLGILEIIATSSGYFCFAGTSTSTWYSRNNCYILWVFLLRWDLNLNLVLSK